MFDINKRKLMKDKNNKDKMVASFWVALSRNKINSQEKEKKEKCHEGKNKTGKNDEIRHAIPNGVIDRCVLEGADETGIGAFWNSILLWYYCGEERRLLTGSHVCTGYFSCGSLAYVFCIWVIYYIAVSMVLFGVTGFTLRYR